MTPIRAKKSLGQNFLVNPSVGARIVEAARVGEHDTVLEIGPGTGALTRLLAARARRVVAVEKDRRLIEELRRTMPKNVEIVEGDVLKTNMKDLGLGTYAVVANIPYYITSHLIRIVLESWPRPQRIVLMVQEEVAERLVAQPPRMNLLALSVQLFAAPCILMRVRRGNFRPIPSVDSAVVILEPHAPHSNTQDILALARNAFAGKRKQLINSLLAAQPNMTKKQLAQELQCAFIEPSARPEQLSLAQWEALAKCLSKTHSSRS